jgi:hypothetical protein
MKSKKSTRFVWALLILILAIVACNGTSKPTAVPSLAPTASNSSPAILVEPSPAATQGVSPADLPSKPLDQAGDVNSSSMAGAKSISGGDVFVEGFYERPFNANTMDTYFPYMDIVHIQGFKDDTWGYLEMTLVGTDKNGKLPAQYAAELDLNKGGRGNWLIRASNPSSTTWATQGVQAWKDTDGDVGGTVPMIADASPDGGDGYETLVFDQGKGNLSDGAWVRISPNDPKTVQIAFKLSMLGNPSSFAMGAWAGANIDPSQFDYNDHLTHAQAGDPNQGYPLLYPIKALSEIDNTCHLAIGFVPTTKVPGLCTNPVPHAGPGAPPPPPSIPCGCGCIPC